MKRKNRFPIVRIAASALIAATGAAALAANPIFDGWYADPQVRKYGETYWVFPTYSAPYCHQTYFDAYSSKDLKT